MKRVLQQCLFLLLGTIPFQSFAQENLIGLQAGPNIGYRHISDNSKADMYQNDEPLYGFSASLFYEKKISAHFSLHTGLSYVHAQFGADRSDFMYADYQGPLIGAGLGDPGYNRVVLDLNHYYLGVNTKVNYTTSFEKWNFIGGLGLSPEWEIGGNRNMDLYWDDTFVQSSERDLDMRDFNISALGSVGVQYTFSEKFIARLENTFRYGLLENDVYNAPYHLYSSGLSMSVGWIW